MISQPFFTQYPRSSLRTSPVSLQTGPQGMILEEQKQLASSLSTQSGREKRARPTGLSRGPPAQRRRFGPPLPESPSSLVFPESPIESRLLPRAQSMRPAVAVGQRRARPPSLEAEPEAKRLRTYAPHRVSEPVRPPRIPEPMERAYSAILGAASELNTMAPRYGAEPMNPQILQYLYTLTGQITDAANGLRNLIGQQLAEMEQSRGSEDWMEIVQ